MKKKLSLLMALSMGICSIQPLPFTANAGVALEPVNLVVRIYNSETNETVENVNVKIRTCEEEIVDLSVYEEWNTSDSNPHNVFINMDSTTDKNGDNSFCWSINIDEMPEGYSYRNHNYYGPDNCDTPTRHEVDGTLIYEIPLDPIPGVEELTFPLHDTLKLPFNFTDQITGEPIEGVTVKFYELPEHYAPLEKATRLISEWTYKQGDVIEVPFEFNNMSDRSNYAFVIEGVPENYHVLTEKDGIIRYSMNIYDYNNIKNKPDKPFGFSDKPFCFGCHAVNSALSTTTEPLKTARNHWVLLDTTTTTTVVSDITGDANCDTSTNIADATAIVQYIGNPDKYALSKQGLKNADCYNTGDGITGLDAMAIQKLEAKIIDSL